MHYFVRSKCNISDIVCPKWSIWNWVHLISIILCILNRMQNLGQNVSKLQHFWQNLLFVRNTFLFFLRPKQSASELSIIVHLHWLVHSKIHYFEQRAAKMHYFGQHATNVSVSASFSVSIMRHFRQSLYKMKNVITVCPKLLFCVCEMQHFMKSVAKMQHFGKSTENLLFFTE